MSWLDLVLAVILMVSVAGGYRKGLIRIGIGLIATVAALVFACWFYGTAGTFLIPYVTSRSTANLLGFMLVFLGVITLGAVVSRILAAIFKWVGLSWFDRLLGAAFGVVRGAVISIVMIMVIVALSPVSPPPAVVDSEIAPYLIEAADAITMIAPKEFKKGFQQGYEKVKDTWSETFKNSIRKLPSRKD
jgi:membrane protein required for colicin V production